MENVVRDIFDFYKSRIESPIFFSFVLCWSIFNSEYLYNLFFYAEKDKAYLLQLYKFDIYTDIIYPSIFACINVVLLPVLNTYVMQAKYFMLNKVSRKAKYYKNIYDQQLELDELENKKKSLTSDISNLDKQVLSTQAKLELAKNELKAFDDAASERNDFEERVRYSFMVMSAANGTIDSVPDNIVGSFYYSTPVLYSFVAEIDGKEDTFFVNEILMEKSYPFRETVSKLNKLKVGSTFHFKHYKSGDVVGVVKHVDYYNGGI